MGLTDVCISQLSSLGSVTLCLCVCVCVQLGVCVQTLAHFQTAVYDRDHYICVLLQAVEEACLDIAVEACQGWIRHARGIVD